MTSNFIPKNWVNEENQKEILRESTIIYKSNFLLLNKLVLSQQYDYQTLFELAYSMLEFGFTEQISSNNFLVDALLTDFQENVSRAHKNYDNKCAANEEKKNLSRIADMYNNGYIQEEIAKVLQVSQGTISNRLREIREKHPDWLED